MWSWTLSFIATPAKRIERRGRWRIILPCRASALGGSSSVSEHVGEAFKAVEKRPATQRINPGLIVRRGRGRPI
jgi:hypothetical protein